jgi:hypothetical protein
MQIPYIIDLNTKDIIIITQMAKRSFFSLLLNNVDHTYQVWKTTVDNAVLYMEMSCSVELNTIDDNTSITPNILGGYATVIKTHKRGKDWHAIQKELKIKADAV